MDELLKHKDDKGPIGDLARELIVIMNDYKAGSINKADRDEIINEVTAIYKAHGHADQEIVAKWAINITKVLLSVV